MKYRGTIKSGYRYRIKATYAIIEVHINESTYKFTFKQKAPYEYNIFNEIGEILVTSKSETKSFLKKILGGGETIFFHEQSEICRITELNRRIIYKDKTYEFDISRDRYTWVFSTDEFELELKKGYATIELNFQKDYLLQCLCCGVYIWHWYVHNSS